MRLSQTTHEGQAAGEEKCGMPIWKAQRRIRKTSRTNAANSWDSLTRKKISGSVQVPGGLGTSPQIIEKTAIPENDGAKSGALSSENGLIDPGLQAVIRAWSDPAIRSAVLAMIDAAWKNG